MLILPTHVVGANCLPNTQAGWQQVTDLRRSGLRRLVIVSHPILCNLDEAMAPTRLCSWLPQQSKALLCVIMGLLSGHVLACWSAKRRQGCYMSDRCMSSSSMPAMLWVLPPSISV